MKIQILVSRNNQVLEDLIVVDESELNDCIYTMVRKHKAYFSLSFSFEPTESAMRITKFEPCKPVHFAYDGFEMNHKGKILSQAYGGYFGKLLNGLRSMWSTCPWKVYRMTILSGYDEIK